ncbi:MAG TPA: fumarate hydratase C-terminal domain-containing protein [Methanobacteriaceae archaeon]|nr:fumarate hydratase C-terminal domain-containing protein [Methanobacteriaceae archaeon]
MEKEDKRVNTPITKAAVKQLQVGDLISIYGVVYTGRDAALPQLVQSIQKGENLIELEGAVIMHTAVSPAGISPTTSNKEEIEENIAPLSKAGVRMHVGKGALSEKTVQALKKYNSVFVVTPPAAALLTSKVISKKVILFEKEGMEAMHCLHVVGLPGIVVIAHGESIYNLED